MNKTRRLRRIINYYKVFKLFLSWLIDILGINAFYRYLNRNKAIIIMYHGICEDDFDLLVDYDERHISKSSFRKQLGYLQRKGFSFINMTELVNQINNGAKLGKNVVLTFDDGFQNIKNNACPIMREYNAKGCFYLVSSFTGTDRLLWPDYIETVIRNQGNDSFNFFYRGEEIGYNLGNKRSREQAMSDIVWKLFDIPNNKERLSHLDQFSSVILTEIPEEFKLINWEQIKDLDPEFMEIGNHSRSHPNCVSLISKEELTEEIILSKKDIEDKTGRPVKHFCYPFGSYDQAVTDKVKQSGCKSAVTTNVGFIDNNSDLFKLNRITPEESFILFKTRISGSSQLFKYFRLLLKILKLRK